MKKIYLFGCVFLLASLASVELFGQNPQAGIVVAGNGAAGSAPNQLSNPRGIFVDGSGNLFVADHSNNRIQKFAPGATNGVTVAPVSPSSTLQNSAADVFVDASGALYIADDLGTRILKYPPGQGEGRILIQATPVPPNNQTFFSPMGISVDASANVFISDGTRGARILKYPYAPDTIFGQGENVAVSPIVSSYNDVFVNAAGDIYVSDGTNQRVLKFAAGSTTGIVVAGGNGSGAASNQLSRPQGIYVDKSGNVYVADFDNNRIQKWTPGATSGVTVAGGNGAGNATNQLNQPLSVEVDTAGQIYVSDNGNNRIIKFVQGGLSYKYYEGSWNSLPDFNAITPVNTGFTGNTDISVRTPGRDDNFAFLWQGYIKIPAPGTYTFETVSDDGSRFYFNTVYNSSAIPTVDNDGVHAPVSATGTVFIASAGTYPVSISYFEKDGGQQMQVYWTGPGIARQLIPDNAFTLVPPATPPPASAANLNYVYYEGGFNALPDFSKLTPVKSGTSSNFDIGIRRQGVNDSFAIVWDGYIHIPTAGSYTFETISDDGSKLYFNGSELVNNDGNHPPQSATGTINIPTAGNYPIKVAYFENYGDQSLQVLWSGPGITRQQIPDTAFVPAATVQPPTNGLTYKYYQGDFNVLPDFSTLAPIKIGVSSNTDIGVRTPGVDDHFAFMWQGYIHLPSAGTYTFETISDDGSKVYFNTDYAVNAFAVVKNDGLHPATAVSGSVTVAAAGVYPIVITYFEKDGDQGMQFNWSGPGISYGPVPDSAFTLTSAPVPPSTGGLSYKYYEKDFDALPDFNTLTPVKTGLSDNVDITVRTPGRNDQFAFLWQGYINIPTAGTYTFETISDDGSKLYFNTMYDPAAIPTVNNDGVHAPVSATGTVNVPAAGWYPITISFFEKNGGESMEAYWSGPGLPRQQIPNVAFAQTPSATSTAPVKIGSELLNSMSTEGLVNTRIYPNPFRDGFNIEFYNSSNANNIQVGVYDIRGKLLYLKNAGNMSAGNAMLNVNLNGSVLPEGVYIARLQINGLPYKTVKLVKMK